MTPAPAAWDSVVSLFQWWLTLLLLGLVFVPLVRRLAPSGCVWIGAKTFGLLTSGYAAWLQASFGARMDPLTVTAVVAVAAALLAAPWLRATERPDALRRRWKHYAAEEAFFAALLAGWSAMRALQPGLDGTEKFMDFGLLVSATRATTLPPPDVWFSGHSVNYYYFGHFLAGHLSRLAGVAPAYAYNLALCSVAALSMASIGAIVRSILRSFGASWAGTSLAGGVLAAALLGFGGNLHAFIFGVVQPLIDSTSGMAARQRYWYPMATRFVGYDVPGADKTINEFPAYSFVIGDLHAHLLNLPISLLLVMLLMKVGTQGGLAGRWRVLHRAAIALSLAAMVMTNSWAVPVYMLLTGLVFLLGARMRAEPSAPWVWSGVLQTAVVVAGALLLAIPFLTRFEPFGRGIGLATAHTPVLDLAIQFGYQFALVAAAGWVLMRSTKARVGLAAMPGQSLIIGPLLAASIVCIGVGEVVYVADIYAAEYQRANTVFKLGYEAFVLLTLCASVSAAALARHSSALGRRAGLAMTWVLWGLCVAPMSYAAYAIPQSLAPSQGAHTLDALSSLGRSQPQDRSAIRWLEANASAATSLVEMDGPSYTYAGRLSMASGVPTLLGWRSHEALWRVSAETEIDARSRAVKTILDAKDCAEAARLIGRFKVSHIVVGLKERSELPDLDLARLGRLATVVARFDDTLVLQVKAEGERCVSPP